MLKIAPRDPDYLDWAAQTGTDAVRQRISHFRRLAVCEYCQARDNWPTIEACRPYLSSSDEVVRVMAAQIISCSCAPLDSDCELQVQQILEHAKQLHWRKRASHFAESAPE